MFISTLQSKHEDRVYIFLKKSYSLKIFFCHTSKIWFGLIWRTDCAGPDLRLVGEEEVREEREEIILPGEDLESSTVDLEQIILIEIELIHREIYLLEHDTQIKGWSVFLFNQALIYQTLQNQVYFSVVLSPPWGFHFFFIKLALC